MTMDKDLEEYLVPTYFLDSDHPRVAGFAEDLAKGAVDEKERAIRLYYGVRDQIRYDPYSFEDSREALKASSVLAKKVGFCVPKAVLLAAVARAQEIPSRLGFADVRNHLTTRRLRSYMDTDLFVYHGYVELFIQGRWVKATPAFNLSLCTSFNVKPLEFDGVNDSIFHEFDTLGNRHMEYVTQHGHFPDLPFNRVFEAFRKAYPRILELNRRRMAGDFSQEAREENPA
jgi:transglutaminase-like putative cysteine protease